MMSTEAGLTILLLAMAAGLIYIWLDLRMKLRTITNKLNWIAKKTIDIKPKKD